MLIISCILLLGLGLKLTGYVTYDSPCIGDANNDGVVSAGDYASVQANFGNTCPINNSFCPGDANKDGIVSAADQSAVQANFGNTCKQIVIEVSRLVTDNQVQLAIVSNKNVLAIQEIPSEGCKITNYYTEPEIGVLEFKESENTWILSNISDNLVVNLFYTLSSSTTIANCTGDANGDGEVTSSDYAPIQANFGNVCNPGESCPGDANGDGEVTSSDYASIQANFGNVCNISTPTNCEILSGRYIYVGGESTIEVEEEQPEAQLPVVPETIETSSGSGGGSTSSTGTSSDNTISTEITQVGSEEELDKFTSSALDKIYGVEKGVTMQIYLLCKRSTSTPRPSDDPDCNYMVIKASGDNQKFNTEIQKLNRDYQNNSRILIRYRREEWTNPYFISEMKLEDIPEIKPYINSGSVINSNAVKQCWNEYKETKKE